MAKVGFPILDKYIDSGFKAFSSIKKGIIWEFSIIFFNLVNPSNNLLVSNSFMNNTLSTSINK